MRLRSVLGVSLLAFALVAVVAKMLPRLHDPAAFSADHWAFMDFYRVAYLPGEILREGGNPYGDDYLARDHFEQGYPLFSPLLPAVHAPLTLLPFETLRWFFLALQVGLLLVFARVSLRVCGLGSGLAETCALAALLLLSRPGYSNFLLGQLTLVCTLGCYLALHHAHTRPMLAAFGLLLTSIKVQFALPVALFLLVRRAYRALGVGLALAASGAVIPLVWVAYHRGFGPVFTNFIERYGRGQMPAVTEPGTQFMRIDLADNFSKFLPIPYLVPIFGLLILGGAAWHLRVSSRRPGTWRLDSPSGLLCIAAILLGIYHCAYDFLLLAVPLLAVTFRTHEAWRQMPNPLRLLLVALLAFPFLNHLHYQIQVQLEAGSLAWKMFSSVNTAALASASVLLVAHLAWRVCPSRLSSSYAEMNPEA